MIQDQSGKAITTGVAMSRPTSKTSGHSGSKIYLRLPIAREWRKRITALKIGHKLKFRLLEYLVLPSQPPSSIKGR
jgi:hypothetical protein